MCVCVVITVVQVCVCMRACVCACRPTDLSPKIGIGVWHSLLDIVLVYVVLLVLGGSLMSVTITWIITMVCSVTHYPPGLNP